MAMIGYVLRENIALGIMSVFVGKGCQLLVKASL